MKQQSRHDLVFRCRMFGLTVGDHHSCVRQVGQALCRPGRGDPKNCLLNNSTPTGWWFQIFFMFTPKLGEDEPILTSIYIFQRGWFNHQLANIFSIMRRFWRVRLRSFHFLERLRYFLQTFFAIFWERSFDAIFGDASICGRMDAQSRIGHDLNVKGGIQKLTNRPMSWCCTGEAAQTHQKQKLDQETSAAVAAANLFVCFSVQKFLTTFDS